MSHSSLKANIIARKQRHVLPAFHRTRRRVDSSSTRKRQLSLNYKSKGLVRRKQQDWSSVTRGILEYIHDKLRLTEILQCQTVCSTWASVARANISSSLKKAPPTTRPLILWRRPFYQPHNWFLDVTTPDAPFYQLSDASESMIDELGHCVGFSRGWFIFLDSKKNASLSLFHPMLFPQSFVRIPHIATPERYPYRGFDKVVIWGTQHILASGDYGIVVMNKDNSDDTLLFAKSRGAQFKVLKYDQLRPLTWHDVICFKNIIYGVARSDGDRLHHHLVAWDWNSGEPRKILDIEPTFSCPPDDRKRLFTSNLVESQDELLLVTIQRPHTIKLRRQIRKLRLSEIYPMVRSPNTCRVYKMDFEKQEWVQMDSLGDRVLFIMENQTLSISCQEFPQYTGNTVYFQHYIDVRDESSHIVGVFNIKDGSMSEVESTRDFGD